MLQSPLCESASYRLGYVHCLEKQQKAKDDRQRVTVGYIVEKYLDEEVDRIRKAKGAKETRRMLEHALAKVRNVPAHEIDTKKAHGLVMPITKRAPRLAQMTRQALRACWNYAIESGELDGINPFLGK